MGRKILFFGEIMDEIGLLDTTESSRRQRIQHHHQALDFGPSIFPSRYAIGESDGFSLQSERLENRRWLRIHTPESPGIYGYFDSYGHLNYVGKSKCLKKRLLSYFSKNPADEKMGRIVQHSRFLRWEPISHELLALLREQELIARFRPCFNSQGQPERKQPAFLRISEREAPHVQVHTNLSRPGKTMFGPITGARRLRQTAIDLNHVFRLRDCNDQTAMRFSDQLELFPRSSPAGCIRYEIGSCSGPCTGRISRGDYQTQVAQAEQFLLGHPSHVLTDLAFQMEAASQKCAYEKATMIRDQISNLKWLQSRLEAIRVARTELNCIYPIPGFKRRTIWLCLSSCLVVDALPSPQSRKKAALAIKQIRTSHTAGKIQLPRDTAETLMQLIVAAWFRKHPNERNRLISFADALADCERKIAA